MNEENNLLFNELTPLDIYVRTSFSYWQKILMKHSELIDKLEFVKKAISEPEEIRTSKLDKNILLSYFALNHKWIVAVYRKLNGNGFLITAYMTDAIKEGKTLWHK